MDKLPKLVIKPKFDKKLKELRIKTKFLKHCNNPSRWNDMLHATRSYREMQNNTDKWQDFIEYSFHWDNTIDGYFYWNNIANN